NIFGVPVGISDQSLDPVLVPAIATAFGSVITEKHITISKDSDGLDDPIALNSEQFACLVYAIHECNAAILKYGKLSGRNHILKELRKKYGRKKIASVIGTGVKELAPSEEKNYGRTNRSLHFTKDLSAGSIINEEDISVLRTEKVLNSGLPSEHYYLLLGTRLTRDVKSGEGVQWEDVLQKNEEL
ncbi:MAG: N-acetylneuraminate synthase family protein, partial [Treponema sp.]|nr:N-acetylneuraminate synthase family protein [Treponema sp.]